MPTQEEIEQNIAMGLTPEGTAPGTLQDVSKVPPPPAETPPEPPAGPPEPPPTILKDPDIPKVGDPGVTVEERLANGQPSVLSKDGEKYYLPGSTAYESGNRTESQYLRTQQFSSALGPYNATNVQGPSVVILDGDGNPVARWNQAMIDKSHSDPSYGASIDEYLAKGQYRVPVKDSEGREVLLTPKQADRLNNAQTNSDKLAVAKDLNLVPQDMTLKDFSATAPISSNVTDTKIIGGKAVQVGKTAASAFEYQQFLNSTVALKDGRIDKSQLASIQKSDPDMYKALMSGGFAAGQAYSDAKLAAFNASNQAIPDGKGGTTYIDRQKLAELQSQNPTAADILTSQGIPGLDKAYEDAKAQLGNKPLVDAIGNLRTSQNPQLAQAVQLLYSKKDIQEATGNDARVYSQFQGIDNPFKGQIPGKDRVYQINISPVSKALGLMIVGEASSEAVPNPVSTVALAITAAALGGVTLYQNKDAIITAINNFNNNMGRQPTSSEVMVANPKTGEVVTLDQFTKDQRRPPNITPPSPVPTPVAQETFPGRTLDALRNPPSPVTAPQGLQKVGDMETSATAQEMAANLGQSANWKKPVILIPTGGRPMVVPEDLVNDKKTLIEKQKVYISTADRPDVRDLPNLAPEVKSTSLPDQPLTQQEWTQITDSMKQDKINRAIEQEAVRLHERNLTRGIKTEDTHQLVRNAAEQSAVRAMNQRALERQIAEYESMSKAMASWLAKYKTGKIAKTKTYTNIKSIQSYIMARKSYLEALKAYNLNLSKVATNIGVKPINGKLTKTMAQSYVDTKVNSMALPAVRVEVGIQQTPKPQEATQEKVAQAVKVATKTKEATRTKEAENVKEAEAAKTAEIAQTAEREATTEMETTDTTTTIEIPKPKKDKENRSRIKKSGGAVAWREGELGPGKDVWATAVYPYDSDRPIYVVGKPPVGATIVQRGKGSAFATAQITRGRGPSHPVTLKSGFENVTISSHDKRVSLDFTPIKSLTAPSITSRSAIITEKRPRISGARFRISGKRPRIR